MSKGGFSTFKTYLKDRKSNNMYYTVLLLLYNTYYFSIYFFYTFRLMVGHSASQGEGRGFETGLAL